MIELPHDFKQGIIVNIMNVTEKTTFQNYLISSLFQTCRCPTPAELSWCAGAHRDGFTHLLIEDKRLTRITIPQLDAEWREAGRSAECSCSSTRQHIPGELDVLTRVIPPPNISHTSFYRDVWDGLHELTNYYGFTRPVHNRESQHVSET